MTSPSLGDPMSKYTGSDLDEFLEDKDILEEVTARAHKRFLALQLNDAMETSNTCKVQLNDVDLLLREIAAWDAASDEVALTIEKMLAEMN
jgi:hypothetical protein